MAKLLVVPYLRSMEFKQLQKPILASVGMAAGAIVILFLAGELRWEWSGARIYYLNLWVFGTIWVFYKHSRKPTSEEPQPMQ